MLRRDGVCGGVQVSALVAEVLRLPPDDKCLIFSEWDEVRSSGCIMAP
jgi:hypothetical protein